jgi:hypothetical protein
MSLVATSMSDERALSERTLVKHCLRPSLTTYLPMCMRMKLLEVYDVSSVPYL